MKPAPLPYERATSGTRAVETMQKHLQSFGASSFGHMENLDKGELLMQFEWRNRQGSIRASAKGYGAIWLRRRPHSRRMQTTKVECEPRALQKGQIAIYSILRDWIKGQITAVEPGCCRLRPRFWVRSCCPPARLCWNGSSATIF